MAAKLVSDAVAKRSSISSRLRTIQTALNKHVSTDMDHVPLNGETLRLYVSNMKRYNDELEQAEVVIYANVTDSTELKNNETSLLKEFEKLGLLYGRAQTLLNELPPLNPKSTAIDIKLPAMELPKFTGNLNEWISFRDLFQATIAASRLSDAQKLQYLKSHLEREPANMLKSFQPTDENYDLAWKTLIDRYENSRQLVLYQLQLLTRQPTMSADNSQQLLKLLDQTLECSRALKVLKVNVEHWDEILIHIILERLTPESRQDWELHFNSTVLPTFQETISYLQARSRALGSGPSKSNNQNSKPNQNHKTKNVAANTGVTNNKPIKCVFCDGEHFSNKCETFLKMSVSQRLDWVKKLNLCLNCLKKGHSYSDCKNKFKCQQCKKPHHTLLHYEKQMPPPSPPATPEDNISGNQGTVNNNQQILLSTALLNVYDRTGHLHVCRALLDSGCHASMVTERLVQRLRLPRKNVSVNITGIGAAGCISTKHQVELKFTSIIKNNFVGEMNAYVLSSVTRDLPLRKCASTWPAIEHIHLADPQFYNPGVIDILIGADILASIMKNGRKSGPPGFPIAQNSYLGWVLSGPVPSSSSTAIQCNTATVDINSTLQKFWELESVPTSSTHTSEEKAAENHFLSTFSRDKTGRFTVKLPFKTNSKPLGDSLSMAIQRFHQQERKMKKDPDLKVKYCSVMNELLASGHMELVPKHEVEKPVGEVNYIPHHPVFKEASSTTSTRIVFDASAKTTTGVSLNENLMVRPKLQDDLVIHIMRFRLHQIALTADIAKMYRQINVQQTDCNFQRIVWREDPDLPIQIYRLRTITYGTASASYQAVKCLQQCATEKSNNFPLASPVILNNFYMDDLLSGESTIPRALELQSQLLKLLTTGCFKLRKWSSNCPELLNSLPESLRETKVPFRLDEDDSIKALGIVWYPATDTFSFIVKLVNIVSLTKRQMLSAIARLFDPVGWLAPVIIIGKILLQQLWILKMDWDDILPEEIQSYWNSVYTELKSLETIKIPRCVVPAQPVSLQLHGFSDASEKAYAAVIYLRTVDIEGNVLVHIINSKSRVAPTKTVSVARLELCGAHLLSKLLVITSKAMNIEKSECYGWTDSTITLAWINGCPSKWMTFVANRVSEIQELIPPHQWHHVRGSENPADVASRGLLPSLLPGHQLWWHGPNWLRDNKLFQLKVLTENVVTASSSEEQKINSEAKTKTILCNVGVGDQSLLYKSSNWAHIKRVTAYCHRFIYNYLHSKQQKSGFLTTVELLAAEKIWIQLVQAETFHAEIQALRNNKPLPHNSKIIALFPFLDKDGILRVGGRIQKALVTPDQKNPILLPRRHHLTQVIILFYHEKNLHAGPQLLLATIQEKYWIPCGRDVIRQFVRRCITCHRHRAVTAHQVMGNLPSSRVTPSRGFLHSGVDYAGPFQILNRAGRGQSTIKCWVALFTCMATRAVHLEAVTDASSETFIGALKRFVSRRGKPVSITSDNGTNFVGANKELKEFILTCSAQAVLKFLGEENISWKFNPPSAPHFGGVWEAEVKSFKTHLRRVTESSKLTYEEFGTLLCQIEACLNSRPITAASPNPEEYMALTPGHFLIGTPLTAIPEPDYTELRLNTLSRWQRQQQMLQHFWKRWSSEYLNRLQHRPKWATPQPNIQVDDLVVVKEDNLPPSGWITARVSKLHPGADGKVRVVTLATSATKSFQRPISKISPLPVDTVFQNPEAIPNNKSE